jgi:hypothetical protein
MAYHLLLLGIVLSSWCSPSLALSARTEYIPENVIAGFHWPYFLYTPAAITNPHILFVPNNSPVVSNDFSYHKDIALGQLNMWKNWADSLGAPLVVPVFPRFDDEFDGSIAPQGLGRGMLETSIAHYARIDLQAIAMIDDAIQRIAGRGIGLDDRVYLWGTSQAGWFVSRFIVLHPERVRAAVAGFLGWPVVPSAQYKDKKLPYPYGLGDMERLTQKCFHHELFNHLPVLVLTGELDNNGWGMPWYVGDEFYRIEFFNWFKNEFGFSAVSLNNGAKKIFEAAGSIASFKILEGYGHYIDDSVSDFALTFLKNAPAVPRIENSCVAEGIPLMPGVSLLLLGKE